MHLSLHRSRIYIQEKKYVIGGFSLVELMIVLFILSLLASIAIPSYRRYTVRNVETDAKKEMLLIANQLEAWRAKALTYKGFEPSQIIKIKDKSEDERTDAEKAQLKIYGDNRIINVPVANPRYQIILGQVTNSTFNTLTTGRGTSWKMVATPTSLVTGGASFMIDSAGRKCQVVGGTISFTATDCGTGTNVSNW